MLTTRILLIFFPIILVCSNGHAQVARECNGTLEKYINDNQYEFKMTSRVDSFSDHKMIITCVQNYITGYFRWKWHIPGHAASFSKPDINENWRPVDLYAGLNRAEGCYLYGNLNTSGRAFFHADRDQLVELDREKTGCPTRFGMLSEPVDVTHALTQETPAVIPQRVRYEQESTFFIRGKNLDKGITRIKHVIYFESGQKDDGIRYAFTGLAHKLLETPDSTELEAAGLMLKPISSGTTPTALASAFLEQIGPKYVLTREGKIIINYTVPKSPRFGSSQVGVYSQGGQVLSTIWVPMIY